MNGERTWLKHGNSAGDLAKIARCGARTRRGTSCRCPAMANGRCRLHGGLSTGPKTPEGIERIRRAVTKHGLYAEQSKAEWRYYRTLLRNCRQFLVGVQANVYGSATNAQE